MPEESNSYTEKGSHNKTVFNERDNWCNHWKDYGKMASHNPAQRMRYKIIIELLKGIGKQELLIDIGSGQGDFFI